MFDFITKNKRLIQVILVIIFLPFAFFGIDQYFRAGGGGQTVARVGDYAISTEEFSRALREQQDAIRRMVQGRVDPAMLDNPELRYQTLETLIQRRLLLEGALRAGVAVSDEQLQRVIASEQAFQDENGKFSMARYEQFLKSERMTPGMFEARLREDLILRQLADGYAESGFVPRTVVERLARLSEQQREVSHAVIAPERFMGQVRLDDGAAKQYYDANPAEFRIPEQARVEYVVFSTASLTQQVQLDPAEARRFYDSNRNQFEVRESRQASHILFSVESGASAEAKQKVRARAEEIHRQLQRKPGSFADLAKKYSQDPGSAAKGGDLGYIPRGSMKDVPEFEDALYQLKPGAISPPVESKLGFHIIRLTTVQPAKGKSFEEVRAQIDADLRKQHVARRFAELADNFNNVVYEQSESLKPAADLIKAAPQTSGWVTRARAAEPALNNPRLLAAIFSDEALKNKRNTEAIEVAPGVVVAARVIEHKPEGVQPFDGVRGAIEKKLALRAAGRLAAEEGRRQLEQLRQGKPVQVAWNAPRLASLTQGRDLPEAVLRQAFRADATKLPAYAGVENPQGGYTLVRVSRVLDSGDIPPERINALAAGLRQVLGREAISAYIATLKQQAGVRINKEQLEKRN